MRIFKALFRSPFSRHSRQVLATAGLLILSSSLLAQSWLWGAEGYGSIKTNATGSPVAADKQGNALAAGEYEGKITFGNVHLSTPSHDVVYLVKYNSSGAVQWAVQPYSDVASRSYCLSDATDTAGNIFVTGYFTGKIAFGSDTLLSNSYYFYYVFTAKYDKNGKSLWAKQSKINSGYGYGVSTDISGNAYITGSFDSTIVFDADTLKSKGTFSAFIVKYDPSGKVLWARQSAGTGRGQGNSVVCSGHSSGKAEYITGNFTDTISFGKDTLVNVSGSWNYPNTFIVEYDQSGNEILARQSILYSNYSWTFGNSVTVDTSGNAYITGYFADTVSFGSTTLYGSNQGYAYLVKYNSAGNELWAKMSSAGWFGYSLASDIYNHIYMSGIGFFNDTIRWSAFSANCSSSSSGTPPSFFIQFDTAGNALCGSVLRNGGGYSNGFGVASDSSGRYTYLAGELNDTVICGIDTLIPLGVISAPYVARWQPCVSSTLNISGSGGISCLNSCNGSANAIPNGGNPPYTYLWNNGETSQTDTGLCPGIYTVTVTDLWGNKITISDTVNMKPAPVVSLNYQSNDTICSSAGIITLFGSPSGGTYNGSAVHGNYFYPDSAKLNNNLITYSYTNSYGCTATVTDSIYVKNCLGIAELTMDNGQLTIEPNPTAGKAELRITNYELGMKYGLDIFNVFGQLVYSKLSIVHYPLSIDLSSNPNGVYFYRVLKESGELQGEGKFIIQH